jgi:hypothetical protein
MDSSTLSIILGALLGVSEALALIPSIQSNSIFELIMNTLKSITSPPDPKDGA